VVTLVSIDTLRLELAVPESEVAQAKVGAKVLFRVVAYPGKVFEGSVRFVSGALRPATRDLVVEALVENKERLLRPGMFANVELVTGSRSLPAVPRASVRAEGGTSRAFFVAGGRVEERLLTLGPESGDLVSVVRGAALGDRVAVGKLEELSNGRAVR
jgi:membrane fusion protein (multidrug efflux system)